MTKFLLTCCTLGVLAAPVASAQEVSNERFQFSPLRIQYGLGSVRLEGMGGFLSAVPDENNEINLNDFGRNPAGFGDDRDSWVMESRYSHREYSQPVILDDQGEPMPVPFGVQDLTSREAVLSFSKYAPGRYGAGVRVDLSGAKTLARGDYTLQPREYSLPASETFDVFNFNFTANRYLSPSFTVGALLDATSETAVTNTRNYYDIDHDSSGLRGGLGAAWHVFRGVTVGGKGELVGNQIDGTSETGNHLDEFSWERPTSVVSGHLFVNRGRLDLGVDYTSKDVSGFEAVVTSWSNRFRDNPGDEEVAQELDAFSEDRTAGKLKVRGMVNVSKKVHLSALYIDQDVDFTVVSTPNVRGSMDGQEVTQTSQLTAVGVGWKLMDNRLLLAGELVNEGNDLEVLLPDLRLDVQDRTLDIQTLRVGGEYFLGETTLVRAGLIQETQTVEIKDHPRGTAADAGDLVKNEYDTYRLALGLGLVPKGGIIQVDLNLDAVLSSDAEQSHTNVGAYVKYLF